MAYAYSKILVSGGAGFIGSYLVDILLNEGFEVTVVDNLYTGHPENIAHHQDREELRFVKGDMRDFDLVKETMKDTCARTLISCVTLNIFYASRWDVCEH